MDSKWTIGSVRIVQRTRVDANERIDGSYDPKSGLIYLWGPDYRDELGMLIVLSHEIGHKIFKELLSSCEHKTWFKICSEESIENSIQESYSSYHAPEEQFCWLINATAYCQAYRNKMMKTVHRMQKELKKSNPKGYTFTKNVFHNPKRVKRKLSKGTDRNIYHSQVEAFKQWLMSLT